MLPSRKPKSPPHNPSTLPPSSELYSIREASKLLGNGFGEWTLRKMIESGELKEGTHWYDVRRRDSVQKKARIHIDAVREMYGISAASRD